MLGEWIESALIKPDGTLEIRFQSGAILTVAGEQHGELEESWDLFTSTDIYNTDIYSHAMPTDNLISVDSADGAVIAFLQPNQIISNKDEFSATVCQDTTRLVMHQSTMAHESS